MPTRRERLVEVLAQDAYTAKELAREMGMKIRDVLDDLEHIQRSKGSAFVTQPATCMACEFEFTDRRKLGTPSRCPTCRSERILGPWMQVV